MIERGVKRRQVSEWANFTLIFSLSFLYKFVIAWRSGIESGWQDEISWRVFASTHTLPATVTEYDAGYPTPVIRALSFLLAQISESYLFCHVIVLLLISTSIASLAFCRITSNKTNFLIAGLVCSYPSFDLLLLHNLSYWLYIPLFVTLINVLSAKVKLTVSMSLATILLISAASKPQILLGVFALIAISIAFRSEMRARLAILTIPIFVLFLAGRLSKSSLNLDLDWHSAVNFVLTVWSHFFVAISSAPTLLFFATAKYFGVGLIITAYFITANVLTLKMYLVTKNEVVDSVLVNSVLASFMISVSSLYIFANSGWSQNNLLSSYEYTSLFSRHYLPIILNISFLIAFRYGGRKVFQYLITFAILQNVCLQVALFHQLYKPI